ncbi:Cyclic nucleotide-gated ion channel 17 [Linum grandiflorum]
MVVWFIIPATRKPRTDHNNNALALIVLLQYIPRLYLIFPLSSQIIKHTGLVTRTAWAGAAYNLILYMLASHVPFFSHMDDQLLDAVCEHLVSSLSTRGTYIVREGDPVTEMLFIIRGSLESSTTNGGRTGFFNTIMLKPGDFCGEELLAWALHPKSSLNLPSSTRTVRLLNEVEAFALQAEDLKFVANQFRRLHIKKLHHTFRYHSHHWRTWAACFIQAAWQRHKKRVVKHSLMMSESFQIDQYERETSLERSSNPAKMNLGVTILASRFAANTRRGVQKTKDVEMLKLLQKPEEPDFSAEADD